MDKKDKTKEDYEFERMGQECTFAPKIYTKKGRNLKDPDTKRI